jgi:hypothetical protein
MYNDVVKHQIIADLDSLVDSLADSWAGQRNYFLLRWNIEYFVDPEVAHTTVASKLHA